MTRPQTTVHATGWFWHEHTALRPHIELPSRASSLCAGVDPSLRGHYEGKRRNWHAMQWKVPRRRAKSSLEAAASAAIRARFSLPSSYAYICLACATWRPSCAWLGCRTHDLSQLSQPAQPQLSSESDGREASQNAPPSLELLYVE